MARSKKSDKNARKPSVKVEDLTPEKNPSGGTNYAKIDISYTKPKPGTEPTKA